MPENSADNFCLVEVKLSQHKKSWMVFSGVQTLSYSRLLILDKRMSVRDIKFMLFKQLRYLIKSPDMSTVSKERRKHMNDQKLLEEEFNWFFYNKETQSTSFEALNPLYQIFINNNLPGEPGIVYGSTQQECDFCLKYHKGSNCLFDFKD